MPMKLRDGSIYSPFESRHMILRDGKAVDSTQASVFNRLIRAPFLWRPLRSNPSSNENIPGEEVKVNRRPSDTTAAASSQASSVGDYLPDFLCQRFIIPPIKSFSEIQQPSHAQMLSSKASQSMHACRSEKQPSNNKSVRKSPRTTALSKQYVDGDKRALRSKFPYPLTLLLVFAYKFFMLSTDAMMQFEKHFKKHSKVAFHVMHRFLYNAQKALWSLLVTMAHHGRKRRESIYGFRTTLRTLNMVIFAFPIVLGVLLLGGYYYSSIQTDHIGNMIPNSIKMSIPAKENVTFWHVPPSGQQYEGTTTAKNLNDGHPIVIHLRDEAFGNSYHRTNVFKVLSDTGYHVIIPNEPIQEIDFLSLWTGIKVLLDKNQDMYLWSDIQNVEDTTPYVDILTQMHLFPRGVIIESTIRDKFDSVRNLEIWRAGVNGDSGNDAPTLNYLKCPLTTPSYKLSFLQQEISLCINTVGFNANFKMRH